MTAFTGRNVSVGIALETVRGTAKTQPDYVYPHLDVNIRDAGSSVRNESAHKTIIKNNKKNTLLIEGDGSVSGKVYAKGIYYFLAQVFGQLPASSTVVGDVAAKQYDYSLLDNNEHLTSTIFIDEPNQKIRFPGAMPESFTITWSPEDYTKIEFPIKSSKSQASTHTTAYVVESEFLPDHASLKIAADLAGLDAAPVLEDIKSFSLTFTKTLSPQQTMSSGKTYQTIYNTDFEVSGSIEKLYKDTTYRALDLDDQVKAIRFALTDTANKAGATTPTTLQFDIASAIFEGQAPNYGLSDISVESINFELIRHEADPTKSVTAKLINKFTYA
jgi:hypothetical protein